MGFKGLTPCSQEEKQNFFVTYLKTTRTSLSAAVCRGSKSENKNLGKKEKEWGGERKKVLKGQETVKQ